MSTRFTRAIQRRHGHRPVAYVCPECHHDRPPLSTFPDTNILGIGGLVWATSGRRLFGHTIHCPHCGSAMTFDEERARRGRRRPV